MNVTPVLAAAKFGAANACIAALATVADDAAELSVYVAKTPLKPKFAVTVAILTLPVAFPETVTELLVVLANVKLFAESIATGCIVKTAIYVPCSYIYAFELSSISPVLIVIIVLLCCICTR